MQPKRYVFGKRLKSKGAANPLTGWKEAIPGSPVRVVKIVNWTNVESCCGLYRGVLSDLAAFLVSIMEHRGGMVCR